jgi:hypothetical protein
VLLDLYVFRLTFVKKVQRRMVLKAVSHTRHISNALYAVLLLFIFISYTGEHEQLRRVHCTCCEYDLLTRPNLARLVCVFTKRLNPNSLLRRRTKSSSPPLWLGSDNSASIIMRSPRLTPGSLHWIQRTGRPEHGGSTPIVRVSRHRNAQLVKCWEEIIDDGELIWRIADLQPVLCTMNTVF